LLQKKKLFHMTFFENIVFYLNNNIIMLFKLNRLFYLIVPYNIFYFKFNLVDLEHISRFILKTYSLHWMRVSFKGKGYRLRKFKKINKLTLNFGHSHWAKVVLDNNIFFFKKIRRQNYLCLSKKYSNYKHIKLSLKFFKKLNSYTKRGLRLKKQFIRRRFGKISQVVSSLH
jgi:hypothetical protein